MKIKLDENLPVRLARTLEKLGHDTDTIPEEGLTGRSDLHIWEAAQEAERFLITQDLDFSDTRRFSPDPTMEFYWFDCVTLDGTHY